MRLRLSTLSFYLRWTLYRARERPRTSLLLLFIISLGWSYIWIYLIHRVYWVRWYWNYAVSFHPLVAYLLPSGRWYPVDYPPRWVPEIYDAPYMADWDVPLLTPANYQDQPRSLVSPAILKLHIFSTPTGNSSITRRLIRSISPLFSLPPEYRHLVDMKFVFGYPMIDGRIHEGLQEGIGVEQRTYGDILQLKGLKNGENLREGKILDWIRTVGMGEDGGREAWWLFKMDEDVRAHFFSLAKVELKDGRQYLTCRISSTSSSPSTRRNPLISDSR